MGGISMIDGITIRTEVEDFESWRNSTNIQFRNSFNDSTGEILIKKRGCQVITTYYGNWETFYLEVKKVLNINTREIITHLYIKGSLHKNHFNGKNFERFNWDNLQNEIRHICKTLFIEPDKARITTIEIGVNIATPFIVKQFLQENVLNYKGKSFNTYKPDRNGFELGLFCDLSQYRIKIYDKGAQNKLAFNLIRFEKKFIKMQSLKKRGITHLSDLLNFTKVYALKYIISEAWDNVLLYDIKDIKTVKTKIGIKDYDLLQNGRNPKHWLQLKSNGIRKFNYFRSKFKNLISIYGENFHPFMSNLIQTEWDSLFQNCTNLPTGELNNLYNITLKIKGNIIQYSLPINKPIYCLPSLCNGPTNVKYN